MTQLVVRSFFAPKRGSSEQEWEDAVAYSERRRTVALADGAGSSYRAAQWSNALVTGFLASDGEVSQDRAAFAAWLQAAAEQFQAASEAVSDAAWYTHDASRQGSFATFAGGVFDDGPVPTFRAVVVGDACIFHVRAGQLVDATHTDPRQFNSHPDLLRSFPHQETFGADSATFRVFDTHPGDVVLLASDALSAALLALSIAGQPVWSFCTSIGFRTFANAVEDLRGSGVMENDDVALVRVRLGSTVT